MSITGIPGFDGINTALIMTDKNGCIVYKNKAARKRYPRPSLGTSLVKLISDDTRDDFTMLMSCGKPALIRIRETESHNSCRAVSGPFTYSDTEYLMLVFIDTLHLDPSMVLFADFYPKIPLFWNKLSVILGMLSENTSVSGSNPSYGRFRGRMNELLNITAGQYLSSILSNTNAGDINLKQLIDILCEAADSVPARYDCKVRFDRMGIDNKLTFSISLNLIEYLSSFFLSLLPMLGISSDRYVTVSFDPDTCPGQLITNMKTRIPPCDLNCTNASDFERLTELYPNESLNLFVYQIMSCILGFGAGYSVSESDGHTFITFSVSVEKTTANIVILRSTDDESVCSPKIASQPMELMYDLLSGLEDSEDND